jgi:hypothetical protein
MKVNEQLVREFYRAIAHSISTEVRIIHPYYKSVRSFCVNSENDFFSRVEHYNGTNQIYVGINERRVSGTKNKDVIYVSNIVIDVDAVRAKGFEKEMATYEEIEKAKVVANQIIVYLETKGFKKPVKCFSGNGYSLWLFIPRIAISDNNRDLVNEKMQLFQKEIIDKFSDGVNANVDQVGDLARVIRVPGTFNVKGTNSADRPHRWTKCFDEHFVRKDDEVLRKYILGLQSKKPVEKVVTTKERKLSPEQFDRRRELALHDKKLQALMRGEHGGYKSRSEAEMALVCKLVGLGYLKDEIFAIMWKSNLGKWRERPSNYHELTYKKAIGFIRRGSVLKRNKNPYVRSLFAPKKVGA